MNGPHSLIRMNSFPALELFNFLEYAFNDNRERQMARQQHILADLYMYTLGKYCGRHHCRRCNFNSTKIN